MRSIIKLLAILAGLVAFAALMVTTVVATPFVTVKAVAILALVPTVWAIIITIHDMVVMDNHEHYEVRGGFDEDDYRQFTAQDILDL